MAHLVNFHLNSCVPWEAVNGSSSHQPWKPSRDPTARSARDLESTPQTIVGTKRGGKTFDINGDETLRSGDHLTTPLDRCWGLSSNRMTESTRKTNQVNTDNEEHLSLIQTSLLIWPATFFRIISLPSFFSGAPPLSLFFSPSVTRILLGLCCNTQLSASLQPSQRRIQYLFFYTLTLATIILIRPPDLACDARSKCRIPAADAVPLSVVFISFPGSVNALADSFSTHACDTWSCTIA